MHYQWISQHEPSRSEGFQTPCQRRLLCPGKLSFKNKEVIQDIPDKQKLKDKEFTTTRSAMEFAN